MMERMLLIFYISGVSSIEASGLPCGQSVHINATHYKKTGLPHERVKRAKISLQCEKVALALSPLGPCASFIGSLFCFSEGRT